MKTQSRHSPAAASPYRAPSHGSRQHRVTKTSSPATSPRPPYSVCQNYPPMLSPTLASDTGRVPSPNYFGLVVESGGDPRDSSGPASHNWSPSSSVKSFAAALPKQVSLDPNSDFEAFRKAVDLNKGRSFSLATAQLLPPTSQPTPVRPRPPKWNTFTSDPGTETPFSKPVSSFESRSVGKNDNDAYNLHDSAYISSDSKPSSETSLRHSSSITALPPSESPKPFDALQQQFSMVQDSHRDSALSLSLPRPDPPSPVVKSVSPAATLPARLEPGLPAMITGSDLKELFETVDRNKLLVLDVRSAQSFAQSRIRGALNLCIPTTLLKRATFNIQKLQQTFQGNAGSQQFSQWRDMEWIIVYDAHAADKRDAVTAQNMIKKFTNEGYTGKTAVLRGGFTMISGSFPDLIDEQSTEQSPPQGQAPNMGCSLAPVIGGVNLPTLQNDHNPFFSNIRQNMDLADGVGQFEIARPQELDLPQLPTWIRDASADDDRGKKVSEKFLEIELDEQARMRTAYAAFNTNHQSDPKVQLCGVEKGTKNRYKDILPFEHARVRLKGIREGSCDYINASHLSASRSHKRYIASQGPLPATFEDFWSVVWEQDVRVIVMLTAESEGGQLKCHPYWKGKEFGPIKLKALSEKKASLDIDKHRTESASDPWASAAHEMGRRRANTTTSFHQLAKDKNAASTDKSDAPHVTIRKFALSHAAHPFAPIREITHLHFAAWPDFGAPAQPSHLLALVELANVMQRAAMPIATSAVVGSKMPTLDSIPLTWFDEPEQDAYSRPMLVHCSAGCGRTGAFCTVDSVIDMLKRQRQASLGLSRAARDSGGDVIMDMSEELVSPTTQIHSISQGFDRVDDGNGSQSGPGPDTEASWLHDDSIDLIQTTVQDFREQRLSMVQSLRQYVLCYETVLEWFSRMQDRASHGVPGRLRSGSLQQVRR